ncbi:MAG TPA: Ig-like domain repeat protein [Pseudobacteroides sp.]|uniref:Ig-like domain repeat protein n=1 Tax=Pseudobacteroides sp. TaxID=1968840 RepID=UPI002F95EF9D
MTKKRAAILFVVMLLALSMPVIIFGESYSESDIMGDGMTFTYDSDENPWTEDELQLLRRAVNDFYPETLKVFGRPFMIMTVNIAKDPNLSSDGVFEENTIKLKGLNDLSVVLNQMLYMFRGGCRVKLDSFDKGMVSAAARVILERLPQYRDCIKPGNIYYEALNSEIIGGNYRDGLDPRLHDELCSYAWNKVYMENEEFFGWFNVALYQKYMYDSEIINSEDRLIELAEEVQETVEGMKFNEWYERQGCLKGKPAKGIFMNQYPIMDKLAVPQLFHRYDYNRTILRDYESLAWEVTDCYGDELISGNSTEGDNLEDIGEKLGSIGYRGRIKVKYKAEYSGNIIEDVFYQYWDTKTEDLGVFGVLPDSNNGIIRFYTEDDRCIEANVLNGAFTAPELRDIKGKMVTVFNDLNGNVFEKRFNKYEGDYFLLLAPPAPLGLSVSHENGIVKLQWSGELGIDLYKVKRSTAPGGEYVTIADNIAGVGELVTFTDSVADDIKYFYTVSAISGGNESLSSPAKTWGELYNTSIYLTRNGQYYTVGNPVALGVDVISKEGFSPTGSVIFRDGDLIVGEAQLQPFDNNRSRAYITLTFNSIGAHRVVAEYIGNDILQNSTSEVHELLIEKPEMYINLSFVPYISVPGQPVVLTAIVSGTYNELPKGTVTFNAGSMILGKSKLTPLSSGNKAMAQIEVSSLPEGKHLISLDYSGDESYQVVSSAMEHLVSDKFTVTETSLKSNYNPIPYSESVMLKAVVKSLDGQVKSGRVVFRDLDEVLGTAHLVPVEGADYSEAVLEKRINFVGVHHLTAEYQEGDTYAGSVGSLDLLLVSKERKSIELSTLNDSQSGEQILSAELTWTQKEVFPTGKVIFKDGDTVIGEAPFLRVDEREATATLKLKGLIPGLHNITAVYNGDICFDGSSDSEEIAVTAPVKKKYKISGYLESDSNEELSGFSVQIQGTGYYAVTNSNGYFELADVNESDEGCSIKISKAGHLYRIIALEKLNEDLEIGSESSRIQIWGGDIDQDGTINMKGRYHDSQVV